MKILLIEDLPDIARDICAALEKCGGDVTSIIGVDDIIVGQTDEFEALASDGSTVLLDLSVFCLAFVDYELDGAYDGDILVPHLRKSGAVCIGISAKSDLNGSMLLAGAHMSVPKHALVQQLECGELDLEEIVYTFETETGPDENLQALMKSCGF